EVCQADSACCKFAWDANCVAEAQSLCGASCGVGGTGTGGSGSVTIPAAPSSLSAAAASSSQANLAWADHSTNEEGLKIERCTGAGCTSFAHVATVGANVVSWSNTGLASSTSYSYRVRAYNTAGDSGYSNTASATTQGSAELTPPSAPTAL